MNTEKKTDILVVLTGGTIGSQAEDNTIRVSENSAYRLLELYKQSFPDDAVFHVIHPLNILSENLVPKNWLTLCQALNQVTFSDYDGIIIAHGSDTLSYTSAMLAMLYRHTEIPLILIASNYPLMDKRSNGLSNFRNAVCFIKEQNGKGVYSIYANERQESIVYLASRLVEADRFRDQFSSFGNVELGRMEQEHFVYQSSPLNPTMEQLKAPFDQLLPTEINFEKNILVLDPYPGFPYSCLELSDRTGAVLQCTYHSATACAGADEYSFQEFSKQCQNASVPVYLCSFKKGQEQLYETSRTILETGAKPLISISREAALAKLLIAYNQNSLSPEQIMDQNIYFETL